MFLVEWLATHVPAVARLVAKCLDHMPSFSEPQLLDTSGLGGEALHHFRNWAGWEVSR